MVFAHHALRCALLRPYDVTAENVHWRAGRSVGADSADVAPAARWKPEAQPQDMARRRDTIDYRWGILRLVLHSWAVGISDSSTLPLCLTLLLCRRRAGGRRHLIPAVWCIGLLHCTFVRTTRTRSDRSADPKF